MNDQAPFTLWNEETRKCREPSSEEASWIRNMFGDGDLVIGGWLLCITTAYLPNPISLIIGSMPAIFSLPGKEFHHLIPASGYLNPGRGAMSYCLVATDDISNKESDGDGLRGNLGTCKRCRCQFFSDLNHI
jgi:hypothetical protein